jgi:hypothetical protein
MGIKGPLRASIATETRKNQDSSIDPVSVCRVKMFSNESIGSAMLMGFQFHKTRPAYVATGGRSKWAQTSKNGIDIGGGTT